MQVNLGATGKEHEMMQTNFKMERQHSDEMPYPIDRQISIVIANIKFYISILVSNVAAVEEIQ